MNKFEQWASTEARWYQFWLPRSGFFGGVILGCAICAVVFGVKVFG
jgi:hypothetical protein